MFETSSSHKKQTVREFVILRERAKRRVFARDPVFGSSCVPKPLPLKNSNITGVPQAARMIKRAEIGGQ